ncbi:uncharacterized protein LOC144825072 [Lissotriton helveticus]
MHDILIAAMKPSRTCPSAMSTTSMRRQVQQVTPGGNTKGQKVVAGADDAEDEDDRPTTSAGRCGIRGESPLILQAVMLAASHAQEEEEVSEDVDFVDDDDFTCPSTLGMTILMPMRAILPDCKNQSWHHILHQAMFISFLPNKQFPVPPKLRSCKHDRQ